MSTAKEIQKNVNKKQEMDVKEAIEKGLVKSYSLNIIMAQDGIKINQHPENISAMEVVGLLDIVKSMHVKFFQDNFMPDGEKK